MGAAAAAFTSELSFGDGRAYTLRQQSYLLSVGRRLGDRTGVVLSAGLIGGGAFEGEGRRYRVGTGWLASVTGAYRIFGGDDQQLFGITSLSMGFSRTHVEHAESGEDQALSASDLRLGLDVGVTLFGRLRPFALARGFGGPVTFRRAGEDRIGGDRYHYSLGFGVSTEAVSGLDLRFESALFGERALVFATAFAF
ncbi:MAG: hypothetical protein IPI67_25745 [Myxococcales bacterium]|nr:hypothetical protein [Myxococcales bacterium]